MMANDGEAILRRLGELKGRRCVVEREWQDCFDVSFPMRGALLASSGTASPDGNLSYGTTKKAEILDSTATDSGRILAAALVAGLTPSSSLWMELEIDGADDDGKRWLSNASRMVWQNIHAANFDAVAMESMLDLVAAGMFPMFVDANESGFQFEEWPLASCWFAASRRGGPIDTVIRELSMTAQQAVAEYGETMVSPAVRELASTKPDEMVPFVWMICPRGKGYNGPRADRMPIRSCHLETATKHIVRESGYHEMPLVIPRWMQLPDSVYALGPMHDAKPHIKTLNKVVEFVLANADMAIAGMWIAQDDGVLNPRTIRIGPRKVIVANSVDSMKALQPASKFDVAVLEIDRMQNAIRKLLMADQLTPQDGPAITATEANIRVEMIRQQLGPVYGRFLSEFLKPLVERCFGLMFRDGAFGVPPESIRGKEYTVKYLSPIARAQRLTDVSAMDRYEASILNTAQASGMTSLLDQYDWDAAARHRSELLGVPADLLPDEDDIKATREAKQQEKAQAQQQEQTMQMAAMAQKGGI